MTTTQTINVALDSRSYDIVVGENVLATAGSYIKEVIAQPRVFIITDENVASLEHLITLQRSLEDVDIVHDTLVLSPGETSKSFSQLENLLNDLLHHKPERNVTLIALGGGVVGDITGFTASILLRGVDFIQIPTTLLAMVDSSVGGKTGINTIYGKNLVGSFYQPKLVLADISLLETLPNREQLAGYAEIVKYGLINDADFFAQLEQSSGKVAIDVIVKSCQSKASIVAADEKEAGKRALLNLGHTFGHALEAEMGYSNALLHGEAVAIGIVLAYKFSFTRGLCAKEDIERVEQHFTQVGLPTSPLVLDHDFSAKALVDHMKQDKKVKDGNLVFILVKGIGQAYIEHNVSEHDVLAFLTKILEDS